MSIVNCWQILFYIGVYNYQEFLHSVYESVDSSRGNILGCKCVKCDTMETDHHGQQDWELDIYFVCFSFILKCITLNLSMMQDNAITINELRLDVLASLIYLQCFGVFFPVVYK